MPQPHEPGRLAFVGRERELEELLTGLASLCTRRGALLLVSGEPGIGKTRLVGEVARAAERDGVIALWGRCREAEGRSPYWPWLQIFGAYARVRGAALVAAEMEAGVYPLGRLVPELRPHLTEGGAPASSEPETARFRLFQDATSFLRRIAERLPMLLVLEDLHCADQPSLLLLEFLTHELPETPIVVMGTYRELEASRDVVVADALARIARRGRELILRGLTAEEVSRFVEIVTGHPVTAVVARRLHRETEGNPFFLDEIVRQARERLRDDDWHSASTSTRPPITQGIRGAIRERLAPLGPETRSLLAAAAVAGREFELPLLAEVTRTGRMQLLDLLSATVDLDLVTEVAGRPGRYRFTHALIRETIYEQLPPARRTELHRRFGELLEERLRGSFDERLAELAYHFFEASPAGGEEKAMEYAERAGRQAMQVLGYEDAADQFGRALHLAELGLAGDPARQCALLLALGEAQNRVGCGEPAADACRRAATLARRIGAPAMLARAAIGLSDVGTGWTEYGRSDETLIGILEEALGALNAGDAALRARVMARLATELCWSAAPARIDELSRDAVEIGRSAGDVAALGYALVARVHCLSDPDHVDERLALTHEILELTGGRGELAVSARLWRIGEALHLGRTDDVVAEREALIRSVNELRQPGDLWMVPAFRSQEALLAGRFDEAERFVEPMLAQPTRRPNAEQASSALIFLIRRDQGCHADLAAGLKSLAYQYPAVTVWRAALAMLYADLDDVTNARIEFEALAADGFATVRFDLTWLFSLACLTEACRVCGTPAEADLLYGKLRQYENRNVAAGPFYYLGPVSQYLGILAASCGRRREAAGHFERALAAARGVGALPYVARILVDYAAVLEADGDPRGRHSGCRLRREATELARRLGMKRLLARIQADRTPAVDAQPVADVETRAILKPAGDVWTVAYGGRSALLKPLKGLVYLRRLLGSPRRAFHVLELIAFEASAPVHAEDDLGPLLDDRAKAELHARRRTLASEADEAERNNDHHRASRLREEAERIGEELSRAMGLRGRDRRLGATSERARASVTKAIRSAIDAIQRCDPALGTALRRTIRTGTFCSHEPVDEVAVQWDLGDGAERGESG